MFSFFLLCFMFSLVLENRFPDTGELSDQQNEASFGILNREDARLRHLTDWPCAFQIFAVN